MKIIDFGYIIPSIIILLGIPVLLWLKLWSHSPQPLHITIYGSTIQTALLAYYIDKSIERQYGRQSKQLLNISLVSPFGQSQKTPRQTDKTLVTFCGVEQHLVGMLNDLALNFEISQYGIYFSLLKSGKNIQASNIQTYRIQEQYPFSSLFQYGLSHLTARNLFQRLQDGLERDSGFRSGEEEGQIEEMSMASSIKHLFPYQFQESGIRYLSQNIGLDQQYIHDYIMPVVWGSYLHQANSITTMFKLLPLYCTKNKQIGSSLAILVDENQLYQKIMQKIKYANVHHIYNHHLQQFQILSQDTQQSPSKSPLKPTQHQAPSPQQQPAPSLHPQIQITYLDTFVPQSKQQQQKQPSDQQQLSYERLRTNLLFIIEDYEMVNKKQISYYKTVVDGKITGDEDYQEMFTLYLSYQREQEGAGQGDTNNDKYIYSATRLCSQNCKGFNKNVYLLISKQKLTEKDLGMFQEHHIVYYKKFWLPKTQLPSNQRFQQTENVYRIYDTQSISDSYEFKLTVFDQLSRTVLSKMNQ